MISRLTSIIILTLNCLRYTQECIGSVRQFTPEPNELIVIDNGSSDGTQGFLARLPGVRLISNSDNLGYARGNNQGIEASRGEYILFLNNDTVVTKGWLTKLLTCLNSGKLVGAVGPKTNRLGNTRQVIRPLTYGNIQEMHLFAAKLGGSSPARWETVPMLSGFCLLTRRSLLERVGRFDERFGLGLCEDNDLCLRIRRRGYRLVCAGDTFVHHYRSVSFQENAIDRAKLLEQNLLKLKSKWQGYTI